MDDNKNKPMGWPILYTLATLAGVAVLAILKACGIISMSWPVVIAGLVWVPTALLLITLWVATLLIWIGRTEKKIREYNRRRKISRTLDESMKGLTLNGVGPIYGIRRNKGENNTDYEKRIREKLGLSPRSLPKYETMEQLTLSNVGPIPVFCAHDAIVAIEKLIPNPKNPNTHPDAQIQVLGRIIRQTGWRAPITVSKRSGFIVKGHGRLAAAKLEGLTEVPVDYQNYTNEAEEYADLVADNRIAELAEIDNKLLADIFADIDTGEIPMELTGYTDKEVESLVTGLAEALHNDLTEPDEIPELPEEDQTITQRGDLWILGNHRLVCGDSTNEADRALLLDGAEPQILLMDPPYCSGGFQESGRSTGSIGTKRYDANGKEIKVTIANDTLSTRGYQQLMRSILKQFTGTVVYCFTDWRMWLYLYDVMEESGFGVKNMIVWNKKTPGMGMGWRTQHELIMFAHRTKPAWDNHKGYGNVIEATRSGNELHPTQKPVEILEKLLDNTQWAEGVMDAFGGSGTTLIAAESIGQKSYLMELSPQFVDTIVKRYIRTTGKTSGIRLFRKGKELGREHFERMFTE